MNTFLKLLTKLISLFSKSNEKVKISIVEKNDKELEAESNLTNNSENTFSIYFTLEEIMRSETAVRNSIDNTPSKEQIFQLQQLCAAIMDPIREHYNKPIRVLSGYRCPKLNGRIGGSKNSQHQALNDDAAIDFEFYDKSVNLEAVFHWITQLSGLQFDQCIAEFLPEGWIHISYKVGQNRGKITRAYKSDGKTKYEALGYTEWSK